MLMTRHHRVQVLKQRFLHARQSVNPPRQTNNTNPHRKTNNTNPRRTTNNTKLHPVYNITPRHKCQEQENQACYLTKTVVKHELPPSHANIPSEESENICEATKRCIIHTNYFHRDEEVVLSGRLKRSTAQTKAWHMEVWRSQLATQVLLNMLKVIWSSPSARKVGSYGLTYRTDLVAPWERFGEKIQITGKHGHLMSGKHLLPLFACEKEISESRDITLAWDDVISPFFDMHKVESLYRPNRGFHENSPFPCPQTLLLINPVNWKTRFNTGQGVFYSFAHAMTYALSRGEKMGEDLVNPVPVQCVVFNGTTFHFVCYQLNTLNFCDNNEGIKNMAWILGEQRLYEQVTDKLSKSTEFEEFTSKRVSLVDYNRKVLTETLDDEKSVRVCIEGYNRDTVDHFIDFLFRPAFEDHGMGVEKSLENLLKAKEQSERSEKEAKAEVEVNKSDDKTTGTWWEKLKKKWKF